MGGGPGGINFTISMLSTIKANPGMADMPLLGEKRGSELSAEEYEEAFRIKAEQYPVSRTRSDSEILLPLGRERLAHGTRACEMGLR